MVVANPLFLAGENSPYRVIRIEALGSVPSVIHQKGRGKN